MLNIVVVYDNFLGFIDKVLISKKKITRELINDFTGLSHCRIAKKKSLKYLRGKNLHFADLYIIDRNPLFYKRILRGLDFYRVYLYDKEGRKRPIDF